MRKSVLILNTGGTISMRATERGFAPDPDFLGRLKNVVADPDFAPGLDVQFAEMTPLLDSSNMEPGDWRRIADEITRLGEKADGVLLLHGTDTLAFTASALSFLLEPSRLPVIITGSQIPMSEADSDGLANVQGALAALAEDRSRDVFVWFGGRLMKGNRTTKVHSFGLAAFDAPRMRGRDAKPGELRAALPNVEEGRAMAQVGLLKLYPGISGAVVDALVDSGLQGLVMECYGAGNGPDLNTGFMAALKRAVDTGVVVVAVSQCHFGSVDLYRYATGRALADIGIISGSDMTVEAAVTKLQVLLSLTSDIPAVAEVMTQDLRGEVTIT